MFSVAQSSLLGKDGTKLSLLYSNKTKQDILLGDILSLWADLYPKNFQVQHTLTEHDEAVHGAWNGFTGMITEDMIKESALPAPADDVFIAMCGPPPMQAHVKDCLKKMGYTADMMQ